MTLAASKTIEIYEGRPSTSRHPKLREKAGTVEGRKGDGGSPGDVFGRMAAKPGLPQHVVRVASGDPQDLEAHRRLTSRFLGPLLDRVRRMHAVVDEGLGQDAERVRASAAPREAVPVVRILSAEQKVALSGHTARRTAKFDVVAM